MNLHVDFRWKLCRFDCLLLLIFLKSNWNSIGDAFIFEAIFHCFTNFSHSLIAWYNDRISFQMFSFTTVLLTWSSSRGLKLWCTIGLGILSLVTLVLLDYLKFIAAIELIQISIVEIRKFWHLSTAPSIALIMIVCTNLIYMTHWIITNRLWDQHGGLLFKS